MTFMNHHLPQGCTIKILEPKIYRILPKGIMTLPHKWSMILNCFFYWVMRHPKLVSKFFYSIFIVYSGRKMVHYSVVSSRYFRYPFMGENDIQIGPCWTNNEYRGRGIHYFVIQTILGTYQDKGDFNFWYITREDNIASQRSIEKSIFLENGRGVRIKKFGLRILGAFIMEKLWRVGCWVSPLYSMCEKG